VYQTELNGVHHELGTSGFLYRSNKVMYDHKTKSGWSTLHGAPTFGPLVGQDIKLKRRHVVTTTWGEWKRRHPKTTVLSLDTGHKRDYGEGVAYKSYFANHDLMFKVPKTDDRLRNKDEVVALREGDDQVAVSADFLISNPVYHGKVGETNFVILTDKSGANRVYKSGDVSFTSWDQNDSAVDSNNQKWTLSEKALTQPSGQKLERMAAHRAFWFGWYAQFPKTRLVK